MGRKKERSPEEIDEILNKADPETVDSIEAEFQRDRDYFIADDSFTSYRRLIYYTIAEQDGWKIFNFKSWSRRPVCQMHWCLLDVPENHDCDYICSCRSCPQGTNCDHKWDYTKTKEKCILFYRANSKYETMTKQEIWKSLETQGLRTKKDEIGSW